MTPNHWESSTHNENWEREIAAYDAECKRIDGEYREHTLVVSESGNKDLSDDENEVLRLVLSGVSCTEIAEMHGLEVHDITALLQIVRAKLSLED